MPYHMHRTRLALTAHNFPEGLAVGAGISAVLMLVCSLCVSEPEEAVLRSHPCKASTWELWQIAQMNDWGAWFPELSSLRQRSWQQLLCTTFRKALPLLCPLGPQQLKGQQHRPPSSLANQATAIDGNCWGPSSASNVLNNPWDRWSSPRC